MQYFEMSNVERLSINRKIKRKKKIRFLVIFILILLFILSCFFWRYNL